MSAASYRRVPSVLAARPKVTKPFAQHIGLTPRHALAARRLAERRESVGAYDEALRLWQLALIIEPEASRALAGLVRCLRALERTGEAADLEHTFTTLAQEQPS